MGHLVVLLLALRGGGRILETHSPPAYDPQQHRSTVDAIQPAGDSQESSSSSSSGGAEVVAASPSPVEARRRLMWQPIPRSPFPYTFEAPLVGRAGALMHWKAIGTSLLLSLWASDLLFRGGRSVLATALIGEHVSALSIAMLLITPVVYLWEAFCSSTLSYVRDRRGAQSTDKFIEGAVRRAPRVTFASESFHYHREYYSDSKGRSRSRRVKVVTSRDRCRYVMGGWADRSSAAAAKVATEAAILSRGHFSFSSSPSSSSSSSSPLLRKEGSVTYLKKQWRLPRLPLVKIRVKTALSFADFETAEDFQRQLGRFTALHASKDTHQIVTQRLDIPDDDNDNSDSAGGADGGGICENNSTGKNCEGRRFLAVKDSMDSFVSPLASPVAFWVATCLGLTLPYRFWLDRRCGVATLTFVKEISAPQPAELFLQHGNDAAFQDFQRWNQQRRSGA